MMLSIELILALLAVVLMVAHIFGKIPLWPAVMVVIVLALL